MARKNNHFTTCEMCGHIARRGSVSTLNYHDYQDTSRPKRVPPAITLCPACYQENLRFNQLERQKRK